MSLFGFLFLLFIASVAGSLGDHLAGRRGLGCLASIALGLIGALIGTFLARELNLPLNPYIRFSSHNFPIIWSVIGAALFVAFLNLLSPKKETRDSK